MQRLLLKNTALSKSQATAAVKGADKSVKVFLARCGAAKLTHSRVVFLWGKLLASSAQPKDIFARENSWAKGRYESSCQRVSGSLLTLATSAAEVRRRQWFCLCCAFFNKVGCARLQSASKLALYSLALLLLLFVRQKVRIETKAYNVATKD